MKAKAMTTEIASENIASMKMTTARALLLAACLFAAVPLSARAENPMEVDAAIFMTSANLECGTYYTFVALCMGGQRDTFVEKGKTLWKRGLDLGMATKISPDAMNKKVMMTKDDMIKKTGENCTKMSVLHNTYREFCKNVYDGK
jgi:hypothetical protein